LTPTQRFTMSDKISTHRMMVDGIDLRSKPPKQQKKPQWVGRKTTRCGKINGGENHLAFNPKARAKMSASIKEIKYKRCPFYMVDGITVEKREAEPINTNSGVLYESELCNIERMH